jgi:hypothetical protein
MNIIHRYLFLIIAIFVFPLLSWGQTINKDLLILSVNPPNPRPLEKVEINLISYSLDINKTKNTWFINDQFQKTDYGLKDFFITTGKNGETTKVRVQAEIIGGDTYEGEMSFTVSDTDLIYEFLSYTPPFYKGKTLNPNEGLVIVTAIPELIDSSGQKIPNDKLVFSWKRNDKVEQDANGVGKNFFIFSGTIPVRDSLIEVNISSLDDKITSSKTIKINNDKPKIVFYEDSPIYGIMFNKAIKSGVRMFTDEFKVRAIPYFTTVGYTNSPDLNYKWSLNGNSISNLTDEDKNVMIFRQESEGSGSATVGLKVENNSRIFQFTENSFSLNFEK